MNNLKNEEYSCLINALTTHIRELEIKADERMIETKVYFEEEDEKLAQIKNNKRTAEDLKQKLVKEWRNVLSQE